MPRFPATRGNTAFNEVNEAGGGDAMSIGMSDSPQPYQSLVK
jgi:hypothetical protein